MNPDHPSSSGIIRRGRWSCGFWLQLSLALYKNGGSYRVWLWVEDECHWRIWTYSTSGCEWHSKSIPESNLNGNLFPLSNQSKCNQKWFLWAATAQGRKTNRISNIQTHSCSVSTVVLELRKSCTFQQPVQNVFAFFVCLSAPLQVELREIKQPRQWSSLGGI